MSGPVTIVVAAVEQATGVTVSGDERVEVAVGGTTETVELVVQPDASAVTVQVIEAAEVVALSVAAAAETVTLAITEPGDDSRLVPETFETVSKNLRCHPATLTYAAGELVSIAYATPQGTVTKSFVRVDGRLVSIVLSGAVPPGIPTTKTLTYAGDSLAGVAYG